MTSGSMFTTLLLYVVHMDIRTGYIILLQLKDLRVGQWEELCIGLTQENSIESSVQDSLPYIQIPNSLCKLFLTHSKQPCVCLKVNMCFTCCMTSSFHASCDLWLCHMMWPAVWQHNLYHSNSNPSSKNRQKGK